MKKRPKRKSQKPPPAGPLLAQGAARGPLQYKVIELSTVDEAALEATLNEWVGRGWHLDGIQFAMREASKRPAMAFVLFTREGEAAPQDVAAAQAHLRRLAQQTHEKRRPVSAYERLAQLAEEDEP